MANHDYYIYIMSGHNHRLYVGVTHDLPRRVQQHKEQAVQGFTQRYHLTQLVYYEHFTSIRDAIAREKQLKGWTRAKKLALIATMNPEWLDLSSNNLP